MVPLSRPGDHFPSEEGVTFVREEGGHFPSEFPSFSEQWSLPGHCQRRWSIQGSLYPQGGCPDLHPQPRWCCFCGTQGWWLPPLWCEKPDVEASCDHEQDCGQDWDDGGGIKIESPRDIKWIKKVDRVFDGLVFNGYIRFDLLYNPGGLDQGWDSQESYLNPHCSFFAVGVPSWWSKKVTKRWPKLVNTKKKDFVNAW